MGGGLDLGIGVRRSGIGDRGIRSLSGETVLACGTSGDIHLIRTILRFRSTFLRLEGTANRFFEPSSECLVSERATRADVPAQLPQLLFRHGAVQERFPIGNHGWDCASGNRLYISAPNSRHHSLGSSMQAA